MKGFTKPALIAAVIAGISCVVFFAPSLKAQDNVTTVVDAKIATIEITELTAEEAKGILFMREEEKLARDVYRAIYDKWGIRIFSSITASEQTHMDALEKIIKRYGLKDPVSDDVPGVFKNDMLADLYTELIDKAGKSLNDALIVGAQIEELDIADLKKWIEATDNDDVRILYQNLMKGSRNHLRSFNRQVERAGVKYTPAYLNADLFNRIVTSPRERGAILDPDYTF
ncbi:MAG: DUF2202 domain-containing protein [Deltaproteobacteria bacterium]|uniref:DUF2202 domain-containing protein n=1 Tax=Candidatus Zymogenus saltonus TaxID=2844893 RepID=A0A9D8PKJ7_9DELT|nr:DUF2202 domain-containing protein [Candidatus Zymogenus saltonus]